VFLFRSRKIDSFRYAQKRRTRPSLNPSHPTSPLHSFLLPRPPHPHTPPLSTPPPSTFLSLSPTTLSYTPLFVIPLDSPSPPPSPLPLFPRRTAPSNRLLSPNPFHLYSSYHPFLTPSSLLISLSPHPPLTYFTPILCPSTYSFVVSASSPLYSLEFSPPTLRVPFYPLSSFTLCSLSLYPLTSSPPPYQICLFFPPHRTPLSPPSLVIQRATGIPLSFPHRRTYAGAF